MKESITANSGLTYIQEHLVDTSDRLEFNQFLQLPNQFLSSGFRFIRARIIGITKVVCHFHIASELCRSPIPIAVKSNTLP